MSEPLSDFRQRWDCNEGIKREFKRIARAEQWRKATLYAQGVQEHMEVRILAIPHQGKHYFAEPSPKLRKLVLSHRLLHLDENGAPWYVFRVDLDFAVTFGGYNLNMSTNRDNEPKPFGEPVPWEKLMMEDAEFPQDFEHMPEWLQKRI